MYNMAYQLLRRVLNPLYRLTRRAVYAAGSVASQSKLLACANTMQMKNNGLRQSFTHSGENRAGSYAFRLGMKRYKKGESATFSESSNKYVCMHEV